MDQLLKKCTSFVIAHRLSTIRNADRILVIEMAESQKQVTIKNCYEKRANIIIYILASSGSNWKRNIIFSILPNRLLRIMPSSTSDLICFPALELMQNNNHRTRRKTSPNNQRNFRLVYRIIRGAFITFSNAKGAEASASLAYYTLFSCFPFCLFWLVLVHTCMTSNN
jgi:hypothetical protein